MELEKIRNLGSDELKHEEQQASEQLFRLRFQMRLGQTEGVKKLRGLKKDVARMKTVERERELGLVVASHHSEHAEPGSTGKAAKKTAKKAAKKTAKKKPVAAKKASAGKAKAKKSVAKKKTGKKNLGKKEAR